MLRVISHKNLYKYCIACIACFTKNNIFLVTLNDFSYQSTSGGKRMEVLNDR